MDMICNMALTSWAKLNAVISILTEEQLNEMITFEKDNRRRGQLLKRMHQRFCKLRNEREWIELIGSV